MNGIHDMGGMHGLGEIGYRVNEPGFHEPWELRAFALVQAMGTGGLRSHIERISAADYLRMGYYERWYTALVSRTIETGVVTLSEVQSGRADPTSVKATTALTPADARELPFRPPRPSKTSSLPRSFMSETACAAGTYIHPPTRECRVTLVARWVSWSAIAVSSICRTVRECRPSPSHSMSI